MQLKWWHTYVVLIMLSFFGGHKIVNFEGFIYLALGIGFIGTAINAIIWFFNKPKAIMWRYLDNDIEHEVTEQQLIQLIKTCTLKAGTKITTDELNKWVELPELEFMLPQLIGNKSRKSNTLIDKITGWVIAIIIIGLLVLMGNTTPINDDQQER